MTYNLPTKSGKIIKLNKVEIVVSSNERIEGGYYTETRMFGIPPKCRKSQLLTTSLCYGSIAIHPLFVNGEWHQVDPEEFRKMIRVIPVVPYRNDDKIKNITSELEVMARSHEEKVCDCPAVTNKN